MRTLKAVACTLMLIPAAAAAQQHGGVPVRVPIGTSHCINGKTDQVWLTLYRVITQRTKGLFIEDRQVQIVANVQAYTDRQQSQPIVFPLSDRVNVRRYSKGQVSLPVEYGLIRAFRLQQGDLRYTGFGLSLSLVSIQSPGPLGAVLEILTGSSQRLPIPDTPVTQAVGYLMNFANNVVAKSIEEANKDQKYTTHSLNLNFDPDGTCTETGPTGDGFEMTGVKAWVMDAGIPGADFVPIEHTNDYCWTADVTPAFVLKATQKQSGKACGDPFYESKFRQVTNDYVGFLLQKRTAGRTVAGLNADIEEVRKQCDALKMSECPAATPPPPETM